MPANSFDRLIADMNEGLDLLAEQRAKAPGRFSKAFRYADDMAGDGAEIQRAIADSRRRAAHSRAMAAEIEALRKRVGATSVATRDVLAAARRDRMRTGLKTVMSKAMRLFAAGEISGDQVRQIEARTNILGGALGL